MITAFLMVLCEPSQLAAVGQNLADLEGVTEVYTTTGSADFIAIVRLSGLDALATLVTERVATLPGIVRTDTHLAMRSYSRRDEVAAFDIGVD